MSFAQGLKRTQGVISWRYGTRCQRSGCCRAAGQCTSRSQTWQCCLRETSRKHPLTGAQYTLHCSTCLDHFMETVQQTHYLWLYSLDCAEIHSCTGQWGKKKMRERGTSCIAGLNQGSSCGGCRHRTHLAASAASSCMPAPRPSSS